MQEACDALLPHRFWRALTTSLGDYAPSQCAFCGSLDARSIRVLLAFLNTITKNEGFKSIPSNSVRNACWHFLALLLELVYPSNNTKECQPIGHNIYRGYPQVHGSIVVAFHLEVLPGYHYLYFPIGRHGSKSSSMDMSKIDIRASDTPLKGIDRR
jgi:hypothetical protein